MIRATTKLFERFSIEGGIQGFNEIESIEFLLEMTKCPGDRQFIAEQLMNRFGSLKNILEAREEVLLTVPGIGSRTASAIRSIISFIRIWERGGMANSTQIRTSNDASRYCLSLLAGERNEKIYAICLNARSAIIGKRLISEGSLSEVNAYPRTIIETALNHNAFGILLCHNHPGGTSWPSAEDIHSTKIIQKALIGLNIGLVDHVIVAGSQTYSMMERGDIQPVAR